MSAVLRHLFVYGSLRRVAARSAHHLLADDVQWLSEGSVGGRLYDLGRYPGLVRARSPRDRVRGEVYRLRHPTRTLARLDRYEDCDAAHGEYRRVLHVVQVAGGGRLRAWVYVYRGALVGRARIPSGDYVLRPARWSASRRR